MQKLISWEINFRENQSPLGSLAFSGYLMRVYLSFIEHIIYIMETFNNIGRKVFPRIRWEH